MSYNAIDLRNPFSFGSVTTAGGAAAEAITISGIQTTDTAIVTLQDDGTNNVTILTAKITAADTLTVTFSGDPSSDAIVSYVAFRPKA